jgi:hypothetical protein
MIKFVSDLRQFGGFSPGPPVSSTNKTDRQDITEILLKVALNTNTLTPRNIYMGKILRKIVIEMLILLKRQHDKV